MDKNLIISPVHGRKRVALCENGELVEFHIERDFGQKIVGNIYKGQIVNVLSGMQAAFVNIGLNRNAFLYTGDIMVAQEDVEGSGIEKEHPINYRAGDVVMIQVVKEQIGTKGARVTTDITLPGRLLVLMPSVNYVGVSKKITDEALREKLHAFVQENKPEGMGFVVRTAAATATEAEIRADIELLTQTWENILRRYEQTEIAQTVYEDGDLIFRTLRDIYKEDIDHIYINDAKIFREVDATVRRLTPQKKGVAVLYEEQEEIFEKFGLMDQIDQLLSRKVWLKNGAYLIIDRTEALTIVDVNTGKYVGSSNLEETVFTTNILAAREIAKQLRLRNVGGIIICDFIDMVTEEHRDAVLSELKQWLAKDRIRTTLVGMTGLGLVEITRKKTHNEISSVLLQPCPYCEGDGEIHSCDYLSFKIRAALLRLFLDEGINGALITLHPTLYDYLMRTHYFEDLLEEQWAGKRVYVLTDPLVHMESFEIQPMQGQIFDLPDAAKLLC